MVPKLILRLWDHCKLLRAGARLEARGCPDDDAAIVALQAPRCLSPYLGGGEEFLQCQGGWQTPPQISLKQ